MLTQLIISNFLLIKEANLDFNAGFTVFTGETGSGKSMLFKAISLLFGKRIDVSVERKAFIQGNFHAPHLAPFLSEHRIPEQKNLTIVRIINKNSANQTFINNVKVNTRTLKKLSLALGELCGQFDGYQLLNTDHRVIFDVNNNHDLVEKYHDWKNAHASLEELTKRTYNSEQELLFLENAIQEISRAQTIESEKNLEEKLLILKNHQKLHETYQSIQYLTEEARNAITKAAILLERLPNALKPELLLASLENIRLSIEDLTIPHIQNDPQTNIHELEDNLYFLRQIKKKYNITDTLDKTYQTFQQSIESLNNINDHLLSLQKQAQEKQKIYQEHAKKLSEERKKRAILLEKQMHDQLCALKLPESEFQVQILSIPPGPYGIDQIQFLLSPHKGQPFLPLKRISGGELSRVLLALQLCLPKKNKIIIFDEIDSGTGGAAAAAIGERLRKIALQRGQVFAITHAPQVAAKADQHILITKTHYETKYQTLNNDERIEEIARMISGEIITVEARQAAKAMIYET